MLIIVSKYTRLKMFLPYIQNTVLIFYFSHSKSIKKLIDCNYNLSKATKFSNSIFSKVHLRCHLLVKGHAWAGLRASSKK